MVLEARENAEIVWYPVVWEEVEDASNVIDYNINKEITKDLSNEINANNQTTTGMANVIPWINSLKLLAKTSIIWNVWWTEPWSAWATLSAGVWFHSDHWGTYYFSQKVFTISNESWDLHYTQWANWIIIPKNATYYIKVSYPEGSTSAKFDTSIMEDNTVLHTYNWNYNNTPYSDEFFIYLHKWKSLWADFVGTAINNITINRTITINIQSVT